MRRNGRRDHSPKGKTLSETLMGRNGLRDHSPKGKTETIGGQWSPSHATGFEGGMIPVTNL